jgi:hypothetical protein
MSLVLSLIVTLSSCELGGTHAKETVNPSDVPNLTSDQVTKIYNEIGETVKQFVDSKGESDLSSRLSESEISLARAQILQKNTNSDIEKEMILPSSIKQMVISKTNSWPRVTFAVSQSSETSSSRLDSIVQSDVYSNYKLFSSVKLFENTELPKFDVSNFGVNQVYLYDTDLKANIADTLNQYCDILENGAASTFANSFALDKLQTQTRQAHQTSEEQMTSVGGSQHETFTLNRDSIVGLRTYTGGALIMAQIDSSWVRTGSGRVLATPSSEAEKALFNGQNSSQTITAQYINYIAIFIPHKNTSDEISVVGAQRYPIAVMPG